jgi:hypothetical protein
MIDSRWVNGATAPRIPEEDTLHTSPAAPPPPLHPLPVPFD